MNQHEVLARRVIGLAMRVHSKLGPGFLESVNQKALMVELRRSGFAAEEARRITVLYENEVVGEFIADLVVCDPITGCELLIEIKAVAALARAHSMQLVNYLSATGMNNGLLLNFGSPSLEFKTKTRLPGNSEQPPDLQT